MSQSDKRNTIIQEKNVKGFWEIFDEIRDGRIDLDQAREKYGWIPVFKYLLKIEVDKHLQKPRLRPNPPRVFISYRWAEGPKGQKLKQWVKRLADYLTKEKNYAVDLDQFYMTDKLEAFSPVVHELVSKIALSHTFISIITDDYYIRPGVAIDERELAIILFNTGYLRMYGIVIDKNPTYFSCDYSQVIHIDNFEDPFHELDNMFKKWEGPILTIGQRETLVDKVEHILLELNKGEFDWVLKELSALEHSNIIMDYNWMLSYTLLCVGQPSRAIKYGLLARKDYSEYLLRKVLIHRLLGIILSELGSYMPAINHLRYSLSLSLTEPYEEYSLCVPYSVEYVNNIINDLDIIYNEHGCKYKYSKAKLWQLRNKINQIYKQESDRRRNLRPLAGLVSETFRLFGTKNQRKYLCINCSSEYYLDIEKQNLCGDCGTVYNIEEGECPCCGNEYHVPLQLVDLTEASKVGCPICRRGRIEPS